MNGSFLLDSTKLICYNNVTKYYKKGDNKMTEENKVLEAEFEPADISEDDRDVLKDALEEQFKKIQTQNLLLGFQTCASTVLEKIMVWEHQPGKRSLNDHKRLVKDLKKFCETGLSKKVNLDGTVSEKDEDDNTKLTEETDESNINESDN